MALVRYAWVLLVFSSQIRCRCQSCVASPELLDSCWISGELARLLMTSRLAHSSGGLQLNKVIYDREKLLIIIIMCTIPGAFWLPKPNWMSGYPTKIKQLFYLKNIIYLLWPYPYRVISSLRAILRFSSFVKWKPWHRVKKFIRKISLVLLCVTACIRKSIGPQSLKTYTY